MSVCIHFLFYFVVWVLVSRVSFHFLLVSPTHLYLVCNSAFPIYTLCPLPPSVIVSLMCTCAPALSSLCLLAWCWTLLGITILDSVPFPWMDLFASLTACPLYDLWIIQVKFYIWTCCFLLYLSPSSVEECYRNKDEQNEKWSQITCSVQDGSVHIKDALA